MLRLPPQHYRPGADYAGAYGDGAGEGARRRIAGRVARQHGLMLETNWPLPLIGLDSFIMTVPAGRTPEQAVEALAHDPQVEWSQPLHQYRAQGAPEGEPNDPLFRVQPAALEWRLADLHRIATGRGVRVAVIDSKIEVEHPDLKGQVQTVQDFVDGHPAQAEQHGTGVAGIIAAVSGNNLGVAGIAPRARLMALRACWQMGDSGAVCDTLSLAKALHFAIDHQAQVINLSLSGPQDMLLGKLIDIATARGIAVVGAFDGGQADGGFPASHAGVVAVSDGSTPVPPGVFVAPGRDVPTTQPGGHWYLVNGSSYAAAHVSGLLALVREHAGPPQGAFSLVTLHPGGGGIDACATLVRTSKPCGCCTSASYNSLASR
jgi:subtilisin family serine protease